MNNKNKAIVNYYCTWDNQGNTTRTLPLDVNDKVNHDSLFGENGWCKTLYPKERKSLMFLLDYGWDQPYGYGDTAVYRQYAGSHRIFEDKFPNYGKTPAERMKTLADNVRACGWAGVGIWIYAGEESEVAKDLDEGVWSEEYWRERLEWSKYAGISYWKIDFGHFLYNAEWRRFITKLGNEIYPDLIIEHTDPEHPLNDIFNTGRYTPEKLKTNLDCLSYSDIYRTYDVTQALSVVSSFDRIGELLCSALPQENDTLGIINCEDELYMAASMGMAMGVMRYPNNPAKRSVDEVGRAVKFSDMAPAFPANSSDNKISDEWFEDRWFFRDQETWKPEAYGHIIMQTAPSSIARNTALPVVKAEGEKPFVSVCKNPNGVFAVATYSRTTPIKYKIYYKAEVTAFAEDSDTIGIFGEYEKLTLVFNSLPENIKIMAADLLKDELEDITKDVQITENSIIISGELIHNLGLSAASEGDNGEPGMLLKVVK